MKRRINKYIVIILLLVICLGLTACFGETKFAIKSSIDTNNIFVGDIIKLEVNSSSSASWSSSNEEILSVDDSGIVTALKEGTALIWVASGENIASMKFTVYNTPTGIDVSDYLISQGLKNIEMNVGDAILLTCTNTTTGEYVDDGSFSTTSGIVEISDEGVLLAKAPGVASITYTSTDSSFAFDVTIISVSGLPTVDITGKQTVDIGNKTTLSCSISNSTYKSGFTWKSSNEAIATVTDKGVVTGVSGGLCTISAISIDNTNCVGNYLIYVVPDYSAMSVIINEIYQITGTGDFTELSNKVVDIVEENYDSVIGVSNMQKYNGSLVEMGIGTGMIYKRIGNTYYVLTNNHVVDEQEELRIYYQKEELYFIGTLLATDSEMDLAVISFESPDKEFNPVTLSTMDTIEQGQFVIAMGHPTGYDYYNSVTFGAISYVNRKMSSDTALYIQHDAAINSGNSGGPLFNMNGEVIGVNTLKLALDTIDNMGFAITIGCVREFLTTFDLLP